MCQSSLFVYWPGGVHSASFSCVSHYCNQHLSPTAHFTPVQGYWKRLCVVLLEVNKFPVMYSENQHAIFIAWGSECLIFFLRNIPKKIILSSFIHPHDLLSSVEHKNYFDECWNWTDFNCIGKKKNIFLLRSQTAFWTMWEWINDQNVKYLKVYFAQRQNSVIIYSTHVVSSLQYMLLAYCAN